MARTGTPLIVKLVRRICRVYGTYGAVDLATRTSPEFAAAVTALVLACQVFEALDDYPMEIDRTAPLSSEDQFGG